MNCHFIDFRLFSCVVISVIGFFLLDPLLHLTYSAGAEDIVVATVNKNIQITKAQLDRVSHEYQKRVRRPFTTKEEKIKLIKNLIRRQLILQQDATKAFRNDPEVEKKIEFYEDNLVIEKYLEENVSRRMKPTEEDLKVYYEKNRHTFASPAKVEARHILLRTRQDTEEVMKKLRQGDDFLQLVQDYSIDLPLARTGGQMARLPIAKGEALPELDKVLFTLNEGEISDIVETEYGCHIVRVDKIIPPIFKPFKEARDQIKKTLTAQRHMGAYNEMAAKLEKDADIKIFEDRLN
jgi:foldase protein PrsA